MGTTLHILAHRWAFSMWNYTTWEMIVIVCLLPRFCSRTLMWPKLRSYSLCIWRSFGMHQAAGPRAALCGYRYSLCAWPRPYDLYLWPLSSLTVKLSLALCVSMAGQEGTCDVNVHNFLPRVFVLKSPGELAIRSEHKYLVVPPVFIGTVVLLSLFLCLVKPKVTSSHPNTREISRDACPVPESSK